MKYKVLLLTSGTGSRLGDIVVHINKALVKVGEKPAICHIIDKYKDDTEFIILLGHFGNQVRDFLELAYPTRTFQYVYVDKYRGPGSSVLYSILQAELQIDCPFIIHACDTIIHEDDNDIPEPDTDWLGGNRAISNDMYTSFDVVDSKVLKIYRKGKELSDYACIGLAGIFDHKAFFKEARNLYKSDPKNSELSNIHVHANLVESGALYQSIIFLKWLDTGNLSGLKEARDLYSTDIENLGKNTESIFRVDDLIIKFFFDKETVRKRVGRASILKGAVPPIVGYKDNFFSYRYVEGEVLASAVNEFIMYDFLKWSKTYLWKKLKHSVDNFKRICRRFYFGKTHKRIQQFLDKYDLKDQPHVINGHKVPEVFDMLDTIPRNKLCTGVPYTFHGDFILDNVVYKDGNFVLIDWRQDFGGQIRSGDIYYDLAKLNVSLIFNQRIVNNGGFTIHQTDSRVDVDILSSYNLLQCKKVFDQFLVDNHFDIKKIELITALIWLNMSPLHEPPLDKFLFFFGKLNLYQILKRNLISS